MRKLLYLTPLAAILLLAGCDRDTTTESRASSDDLQDHAAFIQGHFIGQRFNDELNQQEARGIEVDRDVILSGFRSGLRGDSLGYSPAEVDSIMQAFQLQMSEVAGRFAEAEEAALFAEFDRQENVTVTESGLRFRTVEEGSGASPDSTDLVTIHYEGRLPDGQVFDSSHQRGEPTTLPVDGVVPGFSEALKMMQTGGRYEIILPSRIAYQDGQTLIFDVELISVQAR
jgi:FKBP-type peptidyl-prolyl cis-trans isomerase FkpA